MDQMKKQRENMRILFLNLRGYCTGKTPIVYGDGTQFRDFTHVSDVIQGIRLAIETEKKKKKKN